MTDDRIVEPLSMLSDRDSELAAYYLAVEAHNRVVEYADALPWWRWLASRHAGQVTVITGGYAFELASMLGVDVEVSHG